MHECPDCESFPYAHGYCHRHYSKAWRDGTIGIRQSRQHLHGICRYHVAHAHVARYFGAAKLYPCVKCGATAHGWAYDGTDETQLLGLHRGRGTYLWYSRYPEFYMPLCRRCHGQKDGASTAVELSAYRKQLARQHGWTIVDG